MSERAWLAKGIEGRHVLIGLVAFFGVMLVANGIFVYYALETFAGGDTSDPYAGTTYPSLTKIAKKITSAHWSGPRFFGLVRAIAPHQHDGSDNG